MRNYEIKTIKFRIESFAMEFASQECDECIEKIADEFSIDFKRILLKKLKNEISNRVKITETNKSNMMFKDSIFVCNKDVTIGLDLEQSTFDLVEKAVVMVKNCNLVKDKV